MALRYRIDPRDVPAELAARRLGLSQAAFSTALPNLIARGFPKPDPDTGNFDLDAMDRWCNARNPHLYGAPVAMGARDARDVVGDRLAALRSGHGS
jgi:hypothetical protein